MKTDDIKICNNNCVFCFVDQHPRNLRPALYVKDDDYRHSFLYGNYITLTNLTSAHYREIKKYRLSPLYVSVHTLNERLRRIMLGNPAAPLIIPSLQKLEKAGIKIHTQIVLCPGLNDGDELRQTLSAMNKFSNILSLAIVPVGLTRYHRKNLKPVTPRIARQVFTTVEEYKRTTPDSRYPVYLADEFYLRAGREFPAYSVYRDFCQIENGVGMVVKLRRNFDRCRDRLSRVKGSHKILILTSRSMAGEWRRYAAELNRCTKLQWQVKPLTNPLYGPSVTVAGLLPGAAFRKAIKGNHGGLPLQGNRSIYDCIFIPSSCLNHDHVFLDDVSRDQLSPGVYPVADFTGILKVLRQAM